MARPSTDFLSGISPGIFPALGVSVLLHLGALFGVQLTPPAHDYAPHVLEAHLQAVAAPVKQHVEPEAHPVSRFPPPAHAVTSPLPQPAPLAATEATVTGSPPAPLVEAAHSEPVSAAVQPGSAAPEPAYYDAGQLDAPPHMLGDVQQIYPARARNAEVEGLSPCPCLSMNTV